MIKIIFFDVGETLIHDGALFPGVTDALSQIRGMRTASGNPLILAIISDFFMPAPPPTEAKIAALEARYRQEVLEPNGLSDFFTPFESRVTISSRAGASKPDRRIFATAVSRVGIEAAFNECVFITENVVHLEKCQEYGLTPVHFGQHESMTAFDDWADAPAIIAQVAQTARPGTSPEVANSSNLIQLNDPKLGLLNGVYVEGRGSSNRRSSPSFGLSEEATSSVDDEAADAVNFVCSLLSSGRVEIPGQPKPPFGVTHSVVTDAQGRRRLVRRNYS